MNGLYEIWRDKGNVTNANEAKGIKISQQV